MRSLGVDLGGHNLRVAMVEDGRIVEHAREATASDRGMQAVLAQIARLARQVTAGAEGVPLCVGVPAFLDIQREVALRMPNFPGWEGAPLAAELRRHIDAPLTLENDANCYAVGEGRFGAARGYDSFVVLTLGTGIGGGIVLGRRLLRGSRGMAAEPGHLVMGGDAPCG
ncbi:MAG: ROK family protein, partial [Synergistales bacterium]|nr:ROK family protein [Synergistales bacterium]